MNRYILALTVNNQSGVLSKIAGLFARRGYNIDSLSVGTLDSENLSRMTIVFNGDEKTLEQVKKQLNKLIDIIKVVDLSKDLSIFRELILIKVNTNSTNKREIIDIVDTFRAKIISYNKNSMIIELAGDKAKIDAFTSLISVYGIKELTRTGSVGLIR
ncbi:MAG: acetolactate synthase small subunit [Bacillota bacterium]|nr:acetolactate synthase small subunit [Bacillota bacterium]